MQYTLHIYNKNKCIDDLCIIKLYRYRLDCAVNIVHIYICLPLPYFFLFIIHIDILLYF